MEVSSIQLFKLIKFLSLNADIICLISLFTHFVVVFSLLVFFNCQFAVHTDINSLKYYFIFETQETSDYSTALPTPDTNLLVLIKLLSLFPIIINYQL